MFPLLRLKHQRKHVRLVVVNQHPIRWHDTSKSDTIKAE